jgi:uncharacterized protein YjbJ (UPF0337 family)
MERKPTTTENPSGNPDLFERQWPQVRGQIKTWWDRLTDTDLEQVSGQKAQLIRLVQEKYGYARDRAEQEIDRRLRDYREAGGGSASGRQGEATATTVEGYASSLSATASEVGARAQDMATSAATSVANTMSGAGTYLQDLPGELTEIIRRHPIPSMLVGIGVGFLLARSFGQMRLTSQQGDDWQTGAQPRESGYPDAVIQCVRCGELVRQRDMVHHSTICTGTGVAGHGGSPT